MSNRSLLMSLATAVTLLSLAGCSYDDRNDRHRRVVREEEIIVVEGDGPPPPARYERIVEVRPRPSAIWHPGYWERRPHRWVWVKGYWS